MAEKSASRYPHHPNTSQRGIGPQPILSSFFCDHAQSRAYPDLAKDSAVSDYEWHHARSILALQQKHFWQDESFDHWVRSPEQFDTIRAYIENNPVKAGLAAHPEDWPWSSCTAIFG
jgi:hypothetical protein